MLSEYINTIYTGIITTILGGITWLIRRVLTNQKEIALLQQELTTRDKRRDEDREILLRLEHNMESLRSELQNQILDLYKQK